MRFVRETMLAAMLLMIGFTSGILFFNRIASSYLFNIMEEDAEIVKVAKLEGEK